MIRLKNSRLRLLAAFALFAIAAIAWMLLPKNDQPIYSGIPILKYFPSWASANAAQIPQGLRSVRAPAFTSLQEFSTQTGANAIPWLFQVIRREDSFAKRLYLKHQNRIPSNIRRNLPFPVPASWNREAAEFALSIVVRNWARDSVPYLIEALKTGSAPERLTAARVLRSVGQETAPALPALAENLSFKDSGVPMEALLAILESARIDGEIFEILTDYWMKRHWDLEPTSGLAISARALGAFGPASSAGIPKLIEILSDNTRVRGSTELRVNAARTLGLIGIRNDTVISALLSAERDAESKIREAASEAINEISASTKTGTGNLRLD